MARHTYHCPLRWSDMDAFGHVNNVVFLRYLEEARIDFLFRLAQADGSPSFSGGSVVSHHEIDYLKPLFHRHEPVVIEIWVTKVTAATVRLAYEIRDGGEPGAAPGADGRTERGVLYARASTVIVPYDLQAQRPRRLTDEECAFLERYRDDGSPGPGGRSRQGDESGALVA